MKFSKLFEEGTINKLKLKNKTIMNPMGTLGMANEHGIPNSAWGDYYVARARGGVGLIITGIHPVTDLHEQYITTNLPHMYEDYQGYITAVSLPIEQIHATGAKIFCQLTGGWGRSAIPSLTIKKVAPSAQKNRFNPTEIVPEITKEEIKNLIKAFGKSAKTAQKAGFDGIEVHAVHEGYLLDQFTMDFYNQRTDEYGGSFENRYRLIKEIIDEIRLNCGKDFPISIRYSSKTMMKGYGQGILPEEVDNKKDVGRNIEEGIKAAKLLESFGFDALNVDVGTYDSWYWNHPPMYFEKGGMYMPYVKPIKEVVNIPIIMSGRMDDQDGELAIKALEEKYCDFIAYARPLLADENLVNKMARGDIEDIRPCLSCHDGCLAKQVDLCRIACAVNPMVGREGEILMPTVKIKKIAIIGAGPGGLEAARIAKIRGHEVEIFEKGDEIGGNLLPASKPSFKHDDIKLIKWYKKQLVDLDITIHFNTEIHENDDILDNYDKIIIATGSKPIVPNFPKEQDAIDTIIAETALNDIKQVAKNVVIIGGGLVGSELALYLAKNKHNVTIVDMACDIVGGVHGVCPANYFMLKELFTYYKIDEQLNSCLSKITNNGVDVMTKDGEVSIKAEQVILAIGYTQRNNLPMKLYQRYPDKVSIIGDCKKVSNIMNAIYEGYEIARNI